MDRRTLVHRLFAVLQPLTGARAAGSALVHAVGADVELPANTLGFPIVTSAAGVASMDVTRPVRVAETTVVTAAGASVPVTSVLGGPAQNLGADARVRWMPPVEGLEPTSALEGALAGGAVGPLKKLVFYRALGGATAASDLFFAKAGGPFPAGVLEWIGADYEESRGSGTRAVRDRWRLDVVSSRLDGASERSFELFDLVDDARGLLSTRASVDGCGFSAPGIELLSEEQVANTPSSFIDSITFATHGTVQRTDTRVFSPWLFTSYATTVPATDTQAERTLVAVRDPMPQETP